MANTTKKRQPAASKSKPAAARGPAQSNRQRPSAGNQKVQVIDEQVLRARRQVGAVVLFAVSLFFLCVTIIPGENFWDMMRTVLFGLFGFCAFLWPLVLIYLAVMLALDKPMVGRVSHKLLESVGLILLIAAAIHVFSNTPGDSLWGDIKNAYIIGISHANGGAFGACIGGLLLKLFGKSGAAVTILLLIFVFFMLITGTTLVRLFRTVWAPVKKIEEYSEEKMEQSVRRRKDFNIDVDLGPDEPAPDVLAALADTGPLPDPIPITKGKRKKQPKQEQPAAPEETKPLILDDIIQKAAGEAEAVKAAEPVAAAADPLEELEEKGLGDQPYQLPPIDCLAASKRRDAINYSEELKNNAQRLVDTLKSFGVETKIVDISRGPSVTRYELQPSAGVKISRITNLADDIALNLAASGVRIEAPIPNKAAVGIEVPNKSREMVTVREIIDTNQFRLAKSKLNVALGRDISGNVTCTDLAKMPHLLIAGTTGSGKSVCLNAMIVSLLYNARPDEVKLLMIDPKKVEFGVYNGIPHLLVPVVSDPRKASGALGWAVTEMLNRYKLFADANVRDLSGYNAMLKKKGEKPLPQIVIIIDELSDLMMAAPNEVEDSICRLAQMARAAGMHLVIATQRPSVDVITGIIKANIPSRIALSVSSQVDSRTILDMSGAEKLLGNGDMLFCPIGTTKPIRIQGCYLSDEEVEHVVQYIKSQEATSYDDEVIKEIDRQAAAEKKKNGGPTEPGEGDDSDEMLPKAIETVVEAQMASTTLLQRRLRLGYARAARLVDELEQRGIVGPFEGSKPRKVLITKQQWQEMNALSGDDIAPQPIETDEEAL